MAGKVVDFSERLQRIMNERGLNQSELARLSGVSKSSISRYLSGAWKAKQDTIYSLAQVLRVSEAWLMGYDVDMKPSENKNNKLVPPGFEPMPKMVKRPLVGNIACGEPIIAEENIEDYIDVPENVHCDFCLRCQGDSMIEAGIHNNDIVYIHIQPQVENGQIAAVRIGGEATLKRVFWDEKQQILQLNPANSSMAPLVYSGEALDDIQIEGLAVGYTHWF